MASADGLCCSQIREPAASPMSLEPLLWYKSSELAEIEGSITPDKIDAGTKQLLQDALARYQVEYLKDDPFMRENFPALTNKGRRRELELVIKLCKEEAPSSAIEKALSKLDKATRQLFAPWIKSIPRS